MTHPFFAKGLTQRLTVPNKIVVQSRSDDDPQYSGYAQEATSYALMPKVEYFETYLTSNDQATAIAEAKLAMAQLWCTAGSISVPMNLAQEPFDYIRVVDSREGDERVGNIGRLARHYSILGKGRQSSRWEMTATFGDWQNVRKALANLNVTSDELQNYFSRLSVGDLYAENLTMYMDEITDGPDVYVRQKSLQLNATGLYLAEDTLYTLRVPGEAQHALHKSDTAPTSPETGDFWIDTNYVPNVLKMWDGDSWDELTAEEVAEFNRGTIYRELKNVALTADGLVILDQVQVGTYGLVKAASLSAEGLVLMDQVVDGDYGKVNSTQITAGGAIFISTLTSFATGYDPSGKSKVFRQASAPTAETVGDLWVDTDDNKLYRWSGSAWVSIQDSGIPQALQDAAEAYAYADDAYTLAGTKMKVFRQTSAPTSGMTAGDLWIDTNDGDKPYTYSGSTWIAAYTIIDGGNIVTGTIDCQIVTIQTADSGTRAKLDSAGLHIYGQGIAFRDTGGTIRGYIYAPGADMSYTSTGSIYIDAGSTLYLEGSTLGIKVTSNLSPNADSTYDLGASSLRWEDCYLENINYDGVMTVANPTAAAIIFVPYAHQYGDMGEETKSFRNIWADNHWSSSPKVLKKPSYLKDMEGFKIKWDNENEGDWDYLTLPQPYGKEHHNGLCLTEAISWLVCAMGEVKQRLEALEAK